MSKIKEYVRHLAVVAIASLAAQCAWAEATPKLLINSYNGSNTPADGWVNNLQTGGGTLPMSGKLSANGLSFSINNMNGNFLTGGEVSTDFEDGTYTDIYGENHDSVVDEVKASLCLPEETPFDANIYKSGNIQGAKNGNTATLEGLTPGQKYVVYLGFGRTGADLHSFKIVSSQYGTVESKEYLVTVGKDGSTTKATTYTSFNDGDVLQPGTQGLMVVRLKNITPTSAGKIQFTMPTGRSGINWLAVAEMDQAKLTASIGGDANWSEISWSDEVTAESMLELTLTANTTLTIDSALTFAGLKIKKDASVEGTVDLKVVAKAGFLTVTPEEGVDFSTVEIPTDAAETVLTPTGDALNFIRTSGKTFVFKGTETTGVTLNYGTTTGAQMASHLVFESGKHAMTYGNDNSKLFATGHSNTNPTIWVKNGATLDLTAKDLSGWSGGADVTGVIRVDKGGTLNILQNSNDTFFYRQRLLLEPGAKVTHNFNKDDYGEGRFRWQGGTEKSKAQIYMMDYADDKTNDPAIIEQKGDSQFVLASDNTRGLAIYVGAKAKLQIKSEVYVHSNNDAGLAKYGDGELELIGGGTLHNLNVAEGKVKLTEDADHTVTIRNSATGTGTLEFTKDTVSLGQSYRTMKLVLPTSATLNLTASTTEIADGVITLKTAMTADDFATLSVAVVNSASQEIEHEEISVAEDGTVTIPLVTQGVSSSCAVSSWNASWTGEVVVKGTAESPTTITVDGAYPTGVTSVKVLGNVTFAYTEGATESTVSIQPQSGATVTVTGTPADAIVYAPVNGSTTTFATGSSIKLASGSAINGAVTIAKGATVELTAGGIINTSRAFELHNYGTLELGGTQQQIQSANNSLQTFTQKLTFYSGSVTHGTRSSQAMEIKGGYTYRFFIGYSADAETPVATIDCDLGVSEWDSINCDFQIAQNAGLSLKSVSDAGTVSVSGSIINGLSIGNANSKAVSLSANEKGLRGNVVIGAGTTLVLGGTADDRVSYDTAPIAAFDIAGTLQCDRRQTIAANSKAASVTLRNGGLITGNGTANGQGFTCGLDVYNAFTITVDGAATISTPISITGVDQVITIAKTAEVEAATLTLSGGVTGQTSGKIKLTEGTSLVVSEALAEGKVITDVQGKHVAGATAEDGTTTYTLETDSTGPTRWDDVEDDDITSIVTDIPSDSTLTAADLADWASANEVAFTEGITIPVNALILNCAPDAIPTDLPAEADKALKQIATDLDLVALMKEAVENGGSVTIPAVTGENPYPYAIFKLVPATLGEGVETSAKLFKLSIELK